MNYKKIFYISRKLKENAKFACNYYRENTGLIFMYYLKSETFFFKLARLTTL